jgi:hypothetical protein
MVHKRAVEDSVNGVKAEKDFRRLCKKCKVPAYLAMKRIGMAQSTPHRWKNDKVNPEPWRVNLLTMAVLELAEQAGTIPPEQVAVLAVFRGAPPTRPLPRPAVIQRLRDRADQMEQELKAAQA